MAEKDDFSKNSVTIKSIADEMGISFSTVSKALNNSELVKEETRLAVVQKAIEMDYSPNMLARGLRGKATKTIATIFNDTVNSVLAYMLHSITSEMAVYGYTMLTSDPQFDEKSERNAILSIISRKPDFVIISPATTNLDNLRLLEGLSDRLIVFSERIIGIDCNYVHVDYEMGGYLSASTMLTNGHKKILIITEPLSFPISHHFVKGIHKAYNEFGLPFDESFIKYAHTTVESGYQTVSNLWDENKSDFEPRFTGVITFCDIVAHGVYKALQMRGKNIPQDVSVIGFDDNQLNEFSAPPLSTIRLPSSKMAEACISIIKSKLLEKNKGTFYYSLMPCLIMRKSVMPIQC
jgi:LacI family transcriptional regulator